MISYFLSKHILFSCEKSVHYKACLKDAGDMNLPCFRVLYDCIKVSYPGRGGMAGGETKPFRLIRLGVAAAEVDGVYV